MMAMKNFPSKVMQKLKISCPSYHTIKNNSILTRTQRWSIKTFVGTSNRALVNTRISTQMKTVVYYSTDRDTQKIQSDGNVAISRTPIQEFYNGKSVFITGGTGFLGKIVIQILLKNCPDINRIYMLIREKKEKSSHDRVQEFLKNPIFNSIKERKTCLNEKVIGIPGDCSEEGLGLCKNHRELLTNEVSVVMHLAASIRFDDSLKEAATIHLRGTSEVTDLCKEMTNLKAFLHCSTAYAWNILPVIEEKIYSYKIKYNEVLELVNNKSERIIDDKKFIEPWPTTYLFCKVLSEEMMKDKCADLPTGIFRPGSVSASLREPEPGWIDNYYAYTAVIASMYAGTMRTMIMNPSNRIDLVPVDLTANAVIAGAWDIARQNDRRGNNMLVYNYTTLSDEKFTWGDFVKEAQEYAIAYPSKRTIWYPMLRITQNKHLYKIYAFFLQTLPSSLLDFLARIRGHESRHGIMSNRMRKINDVMKGQSMNEWDFQNNNLKKLWKDLDEHDKEIFPLVMQEKWSKYLEIYMTGIRKFLFQDDPSTLESSRNQIKKYYWMHQSIKLTSGALLFYVLYGISPMIIF